MPIIVMLVVATFLGWLLPKISCTVGYFWPTIFHGFIKVVKHCTNCQLYTLRCWLLHPIAPCHHHQGPFYKWAIYFMECNPLSYGGHKYIIVVAIDYFMKWVEAMPTFNNTKTTITCFFFNHVITQFGVLKQLVSNHGHHFEDETWHDLDSLLGFEHQYSSSYYP
jgi:hypothetical protein